VSQRLANRFCTASNIELAIDCICVELDGALCYVELAGDFLISQPARHQRQDIELSRGKLFDRTASQYIANPTEEFAGHRRFEQ
jgi:hypothetical protein